MGRMDWKMRIIFPFPLLDLKFFRGYAIESIRPHLATVPNGGFDPSSVQTKAFYSQPADRLVNAGDGKIVEKGSGRIIQRAKLLGPPLQSPLGPTAFHCYRSQEQGGQRHYSP